MGKNKSNLIIIIGVFSFFFWAGYSTKYNFFIYSSVFFFVFCIPITIIISVYLNYYLNKNQYHLSKIFLYYRSLSEERIEILNSKFSYYKKLTEKDKAVFRKYINHFLINKKFISDDNFELTEEMKVFIAASAIQILFGRDAFYLSKFSRIKIVDTEQVDLKKMKVLDELIIPWRAFSKGFESMEDGYNPGIKIMAMALSLEKQLNESSIFNFSSNHAFHNLYKLQAERYIATGKSMYKDYGQVDRNEYFAVAVEYFFERPEHFYANQPEMYLALSKLLKQDPLGMYVFKRK